METGSYGDGYRDARKHAAHEIQIAVRNATDELREGRDAAVRAVGAWARRCGKAEAEIERLREALRRIAHSPNGPKTFCRDGHEEAFLIARAALGEDE